MRVLVVGATGALGYSTVTRALSAGHEVRALIRNPGKLHFDSDVEVVTGDAENTEQLHAAVDGCEAVFYCLNVPITQWATKLVPLLQNTLQACRSADARIIFPANVWVFGKGARGEKVAESRPYAPTSRKGRIRVQQELLIKGSGVPFTLVRLPEFYGPNVTNKLMGGPFQNALKGRPIWWYGGHLNVHVEYIFIEDAAAAMVEVSAAKDAEGETFHIPGHSVTTPRAFFREVSGTAHTNVPVRVLSPFLIRCAGLFNKEVRELTDILHLWSDPIVLDGAKYSRRFGHIPQTPYSDGIHRTLEWFAAHPSAAK